MAVKGNKNAWNGGRFIDNGYVKIYIGNGKYAREHRIVMEKHLGRKLRKDESVHHKDESYEGRSNNDISNLKLMTNAEHTKHHQDGIGYCISFSKGTVKEWRLRIGSNSIGWKSAGLYATKQEALIAVSRFKIKQERGS
jgi:hypothetical protein